MSYSFEPSPAVPPPVAPPMAVPPPPQRPRASRAALVATATGAALLASTLTAGVTWSLADNGALTRPSAAATATPEAGPAVVPASSTTTQPDWQAVAIAVQTAAGSGEGSGVIIDAAGHVLTNDHVAGSAQQLKVTLADGRVFDATLVGADPTTDLAVIALTNAPKDLVPATLGDSDAVAVGQAVTAVGNPLGLDSTVTTGIISALDRPVSTGSLTGAEPVETGRSRAEMMPVVTVLSRPSGLA